MRIVSPAVKYAGGGAIVLGIAGFLAGFLGPIALNPEANQGPLVGIFITGPGGALLGAILGGLLGAFSAGLWTALRAFAAAVILLVSGTLFYCPPAPKFVGNVFRARTLSCAPPAALKEEAFAYWEKRIAGASWARPREGWKDGFDAMAAAQPGAVVTVAVEQATGVYLNRKPWNRGTLTAGKAWWVKDRYFVRGAVCADWPAGRAGEFVSGGEDAKGWPPESLPNFLDLQVLEQAPKQRAELLGR